MNVAKKLRCELDHKEPTFVVRHMLRRTSEHASRSRELTHFKAQSEHLTRNSIVAETYVRSQIIRKYLFQIQFYFGRCVQFKMLRKPVSTRDPLV